MSKNEIISFYHEYKRQIILVGIVVGSIICFLIAANVLDYIVSLQLSNIAKNSTTAEPPVDMKYVPSILQNQIHPSMKATNK